MVDSIFTHIAYSNEMGASALCFDHGYDCQTAEDGAEALQEIAIESDQGWRQVMSLLPEKKIILEMFGKENNVCPHCQQDRMLMTMKAADGSSSGGLNSFFSSQQSQSQAHAIHLSQTNTILMVGIIALVLVACQLKK